LLEVEVLLLDDPELLEDVLEELLKEELGLLLLNEIGGLFEGELGELLVLADLREQLLEELHALPDDELALLSEKPLYDE
jgi:hypothetical protein